MQLVVVLALFFSLQAHGIRRTYGTRNAYETDNSNYDVLKTQSSENTCDTSNGQPQELDSILETIADLKFTIEEDALQVKELFDEKLKINLSSVFSSSNKSSIASLDTQARNLLRHLRDELGALAKEGSDPILKAAPAGCTADMYQFTDLQTCLFSTEEFTSICIQAFLDLSVVPKLKEVICSAAEMITGSQTGKENLSQRMTQLLQLSIWLGKITPEQRVNERKFAELEQNLRSIGNFRANGVKKTLKAIQRFLASGVGVTCS